MFVLHPAAEIPVKTNVFPRPRSSSPFFFFSHHPAAPFALRGRCCAFVVVVSRARPSRRRLRAHCRVFNTVFPARAVRAVKACVQTVLRTRFRMRPNVAQDRPTGIRSSRSVLLSILFPADRKIKKILKKPTNFLHRYSTIVRLYTETVQTYL